MECQQTTFKYAQAQSGNTAEIITVTKGSIVSVTEKQAHPDTDGENRKCWNYFQKLFRQFLKPKYIIPVCPRLHSFVLIT